MFLSAEGGVEKIRVYSLSSPNMFLVSDTITSGTLTCVGRVKGLVAVVIQR